MVIAVPVVRVMQVTIDQVVDVIAVRNRRVATVRTVNVACLMTRAVVDRTALRIGRRHLDDMLVVVPIVLAVKMTIVEIAHMVAVLNGRMAAARAVLMVMIVVNFVVHHGLLSL